jgi:hypothetical protein
MLRESTAVIPVQTKEAIEVLKSLGCILKAMKAKNMTAKISLKY